MQLCNWKNCVLLHPLIYEFFQKYKFIIMVRVKNANQSNFINTDQWKKDKWHAYNQTSSLVLYIKINKVPVRTKHIWEPWEPICLTKMCYFFTGKVLLLDKKCYFCLQKKLVIFSKKVLIWEIIIFYKK